MRTALIALAAIPYIAAVIFSSPVQAGHVIDDPADCTGAFGNYRVVCLAQYDPATRDRMFVRTVDQLAATLNSQQQAVLEAALGAAQNNWNSLGAGPQWFSTTPDIGDTISFLKPATLAQTGGAIALTRRCGVLYGTPDVCVTDLGLAIDAQWAEVLVSTDTGFGVGFCFPCQPQSSQQTLLMHEWGHVLGLRHHGSCSDPAPKLMCDGIQTGNPPLGSTDAGSTSDCKGGGSTGDDGVRCIYNWYNCGDTDCDNIGAGDNCPSAPNQTQRDTDGESHSLLPYYNMTDVTSVRGNNAGDICSDDDDGDGQSTGNELFFIPCGTATGPTDPLNDDSDGDMFGDGVECLLGYDPASASNKPLTTPDRDHDGLADGYEILVYLTDPDDRDTDNDKLFDGAEALRYRSDPKSVNTDGGIEPHPCRDGYEASSFNGDYSVNPSDQAILANYFGNNGSSYSQFDHVRRNFDVNRDGSVNVGDQALVASIVAIGGACAP